MSSSTLSLSSKDERPAASLSTYQHGHKHVDCHRKVSVLLRTVQGQMAFPYLFSPSAATKLKNPPNPSCMFSTQEQVGPSAALIAAFSSSDQHPSPTHSKRRKMYEEVQAAYAVLLNKMIERYDRSSSTNFVIPDAYAVTHAKLVASRLHQQYSRLQDGLAVHNKEASML